jgi:hypothetical protein
MTDCASSSVSTAPFDRIRATVDSHPAWSWVAALILSSVWHILHFDSTKTRPASSLAFDEVGSPDCGAADDPEHPDSRAADDSVTHIATVARAGRVPEPDARTKSLPRLGSGSRLSRRASVPDVQGSPRVSDDRRRETRLAAVLVGIAVLIYVARALVFGHPGEMLRYLMDDVAFLLIQALIVWLVLDRVMRRMEREAIRHKLNMVIGAFYSEVGTTLMGAITSCDSDFDQIRPSVLVKQGWQGEDYAEAKRVLGSYDYSIELKPGDLPALKALLLSERSFLLSLLENQTLLEHESFTELLWAVFHLADELSLRPDLSRLPRADAAHIASDMKRAYGLLIAEWIDYMRHLQTQYPYLFSLAVRTNPLDPDASAIIAD